MNEIFFSLNADYIPFNGRYDFISSRERKPRVIQEVNKNHVSICRSIGNRASHNSGVGCCNVLGRSGNHERAL
jgi:hypothetical protein